MRKLTVLVDLDDTMTYLVRAWVPAINKKFGTNVSPEDITGWRVERFFPDLSRNKVYSVMKDPGFWDTVQPREGAQEYLRRLIDDGHNVYVVTASYYVGLEEKMKAVLFRHFPFLTWKNVIITSDKQLVMGDVLIDDAPHNHVGGTYKSIVMDAPHNRGASVDGAIFVKNWEEAYAAVRRIAEDSSPQA